MTWVRFAAAALLVLIAATALLAPVIAPFSYDRQFREATSQPPSARFILGTDDLGRDRWSRLLYATRTSLILAPCAAAVSVVLAFVLSLIRPRAAVSGLTTICLSLPWLFVFIILRAALPLNTTAAVSALLTFALMGVAGWALPARVFTASFASMASSGWMLQAHASGTPAIRIALAHQWPHLRSVALAQFRVLVPAYILSEAGLGLLGLGVSEPLPSWGNLLQDLQHPDVIASNPMVLAPLALLMLVTICLEVL